MRLKYISILGFIIITTIVSAFSFKKQVPEIRKDTLILDLLNILDDTPPIHYISQLDKEKISKGYDIITTGITISPDGKETSKQSKHFVCTDCHNIQVEDPDLTKSDPEARLNYAVKNNLKFLPATTLYGIVNRETWYNDDYQKKYGSLVAPARDTLKNAIQLCAVECSQGRALKDWEMDVVMTYLNSIGFKLSDLNLTGNEYETINKAAYLKSSDLKEKAIKIIKSKYLKKSPATFLEPIPVKERKFGANGNAENGKEIYTLSCMTCHKEEGVTNYKLNYDKLTFKHLKFWSKTNRHYSTYNIIRKGTYALPGYRPYMPNYTLERMSHNQLEDLMAYINEQAK